MKPNSFVFCIWVHLGFILGVSAKFSFIPIIVYLYFNSIFNSLKAFIMVHFDSFSNRVYFINWNWFVIHFQFILSSFEVYSQSFPFISGLLLVYMHSFFVHFDPFVVDFKIQFRLFSLCLFIHLKFIFWMRSFCIHSLFT